MSEGEEHGQKHGHSGEVWAAASSTRLDEALSLLGRPPGMDVEGQDPAAALRVSEARFRALADNIAQLAWMADGSGWIFWYNKRWFDYTGTTLEDMKGWGWQQVHHPDHVDRVVAKIRDHFATGEAWEDLFPLRGRDGEYRWFLSRALPVRDATGQLVCWFGTNTDVTEQRAAEQRLREVDRRKNEFIAMLGHELRNPLAAIRSATDFLHAWRAPEPQLKEALQVLERQSAHMAHLVDGLLDASRIAHGKIELDLTNLDLRALTAQAVQDHLAAAQRRGLAIVSELAEGPLRMMGDSTRMTQVLENLLGNAIKFSQPGGAIIVSLCAEEGQLVLRVRDAGAGIRPELLGRIFHPFEQEAQEVARSAGGLGLGLAVTKGLVELHNGTIEACSDGVGQGAQFSVFIPAVDSPEEELGVEATSPQPAPMRVLIVEDNVDAAVMLSLLLRRRGYDVRLAHLATEGLELLRQQSVDLVLCDLGLPDMSGHHFAAAVRAESEFSHLRLVALTGYGQEDDVRRSRAAGFDAHLTKPIHIDTLERALADLSSVATP